MILRRRVVVCQEWTELVTDYMEGVTPRGLTKAINRHLSGCPHCLEYLAQMRRTVAITGIPLQDDPPDELLDALQRAFEEYQSSDDDSG